MGAMLGIYGNSTEEAVYASQQTEPDGKVLDGSRHWVLRFEPGQLPPVNEFWSITMYSLPERLLVENPINRYSIGDRTAGLKQGADGSLEIYIQHRQPGPDEGVELAARARRARSSSSAASTGPKQAIMDGTWKLPPLVERQ